MMEGEQLEKLAIGDIGGWIFPKYGSKDKRGAELRRVTDRWTGIKDEHIRDCAQNALQTNKRGHYYAISKTGEGRAISIKYIRTRRPFHLLLQFGFGDGLCRLPLLHRLFPP
jgi:hypothetical protein